MQRIGALASIWIGWAIGIVLILVEYCALIAHYLPPVAAVGLEPTL